MPFFQPSCPPPTSPLLIGDPYNGARDLCHANRGAEMLGTLAYGGHYWSTRLDRRREERSRRIKPTHAEETGEQRRKTWVKNRNELGLLVHSLLTDREIEYIHKHALSIRTLIQWVVKEGSKMVWGYPPGLCVNPWCCFVYIGQAGWHRYCRVCAPLWSEVRESLRSWTELTLGVWFTMGLKSGFFWLWSSELPCLFFFTGILPYNDWCLRDNVVQSVREWMGYMFRVILCFYIWYKSQFYYTESLQNCEMYN